MKIKLEESLLPRKSLLLACSSHEARCEGVLGQLKRWMPSEAIVFHYDDKNAEREKRHESIVTALKTGGVVAESIQFAESNSAKSLRDNIERLRNGILRAGKSAIVLDMSVLTKRHLLMMLRWLDDAGCWDRLFIIYTEPEDYEVSEFIPMSFGLDSLRQIPGYSACPDLSRPVHLVMFLGYEGDRARAVYENVQPMQATLMIPYPPYRPSWEGRTEKFNSDLLGLVGERSAMRVDAIDPMGTNDALRLVFGGTERRGLQAKVICPLGTKPQALGVYMYVRDCSDPPAVVYASPRSHNHVFYSRGIGASWLLKAES